MEFKQVRMRLERTVREVLLCYLVSITCYHMARASTNYPWSNRNYNYDREYTDAYGVYNWPESYREQCAGQFQSPVNINSNWVMYNPKFSKRPRVRMDKRFTRGQLVNNGHSPMFVPDNENQVVITDVPNREGVYRLNDIHFHHGGKQAVDLEPMSPFRRGRPVLSTGSEHTVDGNRYEGEAHMMFYNTKYRDMEEAHRQPDGVVGVSRLIESTPNGMRPTPRIRSFNRFLRNQVPKVRHVDSIANTSVDMGMFLPRRWDYYTYSGSQTTPDCEQNVQWMVLDEPMYVNENDWNVFANMDSIGDYKNRYGNFRNIQPTTGRIVESNFRLHPTYDQYTGWAQQRNDSNRDWIYTDPSRYGVAAGLRQPADAWRGDRGRNWRDRGRDLVRGNDRRVAYPSDFDRRYDRRRNGRLNYDTIRRGDRRDGYIYDSAYDPVSTRFRSDGRRNGWNRQRNFASRRFNNRRTRRVD